MNKDYNKYWKYLTWCSVSSTIFCNNLSKVDLLTNWIYYNSFVRFMTPLRDVIGTNKSPWLISFFILVNMFIIISCSLQLQHFRVKTIDLIFFLQMINISNFERFKNCEAIHMGIIYKIHHQVVYIFKNKGKFNVAWHVYFNFQI